MMKLTVLVALALVSMANADCYMSNPSGSNNRLHENTAQRTNANRLFDSQNNNRGGKNCCDKGTGKQETGLNQNEKKASLYFKSADREDSNPQDIYDENSDANDEIQYPMMYYAGSELHMEWAVQHGCGGNEMNDPQKLNCNMVIQYACDQDVKVDGSNVRDEALTVFLANGFDTDAPNEVDNCAAPQDGGNRITLDTIHNAIKANDDVGANGLRGRHESEGSYCECQMRSRDLSLFNADQNLAKDTAQHTRQNNNGNRRGLECPEERDHYPYASPTIWRDAAYLTDDVTRCKWVEETSMNTMLKGKCQEANPDGLLPTLVNLISKDECEGAGGNWNMYGYGITRPECAQAPYTRVNHLGNARGDALNGEGVSPESASYNMTIPTWSTLTTGLIPVVTYPKTGLLANMYAKCVARIRYNVSTDDYDPWTIDSSKNGDGNDANNQDDTDLSPIRNNAAVAVGPVQDNILQLALNTNQYGRTFQDRTHVFFIKKPSAAITAAMSAGKKIINLNVRGKRGSVVQTYPHTTYDFAPTSADVGPGDLVHVQWCGSNTHNNNAPGGDGESGAVGEGLEGTDRHNLVMLKSFDDQFPVPYDKLAELGVANLFAGGCTGADSGIDLSAKDCAVRSASSGFYKNAAELTTKEMDPLLNATPASFMGAGLMITIPEACSAGTKYRYMATRNNKLGVVGQKGVLTCSQTEGSNGGPPPLTGAPPTNTQPGQGNNNGVGDQATAGAGI